MKARNRNRKPTIVATPEPVAEPVAEPAVAVMDAPEEAELPPVATDETEGEHAGEAGEPQAPEAEQPQVPAAPAKPPLVINELSKAVLPWTSDDETRFALTCVLFEPDGRQVATNGHGLAIMTPAVPAKAEEFPVVNGKPAASDTSEGEQRLLHWRHVERVLKMLPREKDVKSFPQLKNAWEIANPEDPEAVHLAMTDLDQSIVVRIRLGSAKFPDYERIKPHGKAVKQVSLDPDYLIRIGQTMKAAGATTVRLTLFEEPGSLVQADGKGDNAALVIYLMPKRD
jgi:hypothetical protein